MWEDGEVGGELGAEKRRAERAASGVVEEKAGGGLEEEFVGDGVVDVTGCEGFGEGCDVSESSKHISLVGGLWCEISEEGETFCVDC